MLRINDVMQACSRLACVVGLLALPLVGCGDLSGDAGGTGGTPGTGGSGGTGGTGGTMVPLFLDLGDGDGGRLEGAWFCEGDTGDNCSDTNAEGKATIEVTVPDDGRIIYTYGKDGWLPVLRTDVVDETFTGSYRHFTVSDARMVEGMGRLDSPYPFEGTGLVEVSTGGIAGAVLELVPARPPNKTYYYDEDGVATLDLEATTSNGQGGFVEVEPGIVQVRVGGNASNCVVASGWPGSEPNTLQIPVKEGYASWSSTRCEEL